VKNANKHYGKLGRLFRLEFTRASMIVRIIWLRWSKKGHYQQALMGIPPGIAPLLAIVPPMPDIVRKQLKRDDSGNFLA
jgi:hypothetical protein